MGRYLARTLRALIVSTLGVGGGVGLFVMIVIVTLNNGPNAFDTAWRSGLAIGFMVGIFLIAVLLPLDLFVRLFLAKGEYRNVWELEQVREVTIKGSSKEALATCRNALLLVPQVKTVSDDSEQMITRAVTGICLRSQGEDIEVEINPVNEGIWTARCTSRPRSASTIFDYGKNFENVETWLSKIKDGGTVVSDTWTLPRENA